MTYLLEDLVWDNIDRSDARHRHLLFHVFVFINEYFILCIVNWQVVASAVHILWGYVPPSGQNMYYTIMFKRL